MYPPKETTMNSQSTADNSEYTAATATAATETAATLTTTTATPMPTPTEATPTEATPTATTPTATTPTATTAKKTTPAAPTTAAKFYAIRKSSQLNGPALFLNVQDFNDHVNDENRKDCKEFNILADAMTYLLNGQEAYSAIYNRLIVAVAAAASASTTARKSTSRKKRSSAAVSSSSSATKKRKKSKKDISSAGASATAAEDGDGATEASSTSAKSAAKPRKLPPILENWDKMIGELTAFRDEHGHVKVPTTNKGESGRTELAKFVQSIRTYYKNLKDSDGNFKQVDENRVNVLSPERIEQLVALGFEFQVHTQVRLPVEQQWNTRYEELKAFKEQHGHMRVSRHDNPQLWGWIKTQRAKYRKSSAAPSAPSSTDNTTTAAATGAAASAAATAAKPKRNSPPPSVSESQQQIRIAKLQLLGFQWTVQQEENEAAWERQFVELIKFKADHGHCRVPKSYPTDRKLSNWVFGQRQAFSKWKRKGTRCSSLTDENIQRLNDIGFEWRLATAADRAANNCEAHTAVRRLHQQLFP